MPTKGSTTKTKGNQRTGKKGGQAMRATGGTKAATTTLLTRQFNSLKPPQQKQWLMRQLGNQIQPTGQKSSAATS